ncbi:DUF1853 family protein [Aurantibacter crassamenti]|uniref:DUF1853 family protein n=1 Tax=Aurantibacter crassamenti TaxID=1837375 RepID=UPI00193A19A6|nr:DUF1853 family protein [Aurantibacter crassamenti]MBM1107073.1 DUF1853 family protein [Aurantibacter crassamenti]
MQNHFLEKQCAGFLNTPPLWAKDQFGMHQFEFPTIDLTDFSPTPIPQNIRLGHQIEYICKQFLDHSKRYEVLVHNLPIYKDKQTLGEIDFILKDVSTEQFIHVELTYKFYIMNPDITEPIHSLIGPNKRDAFFAKMEKIKNKQYQLLHSVEGAHALKEIGIDHTNIEHQTCFKGQVFKKYGAASTSMHPLNQDCICGYWLRLDEFKGEEFRAFQFYIPSKSEWVMQPHEKAKWTSRKNIIEAITIQMLQKKAPMVWMKKSTTDFEKFFVVWW